MLLICTDTYIQNNNYISALRLPGLGTTTSAQIEHGSASLHHGAIWRRKPKTLRCFIAAKNGVIKTHGLQPGISDTTATLNSSGSDITDGIKGQQVISALRVIKPHCNHSASGHKDVASQEHSSDDLWCTQDPPMTLFICVTKRT